MKKKLKLLLTVVLSSIMVMGMSLTAFSATVVMKNPNTSGVQLVGDTLIVQEEHHNFLVAGKALMLQCPGVTDILPNNSNNLIDVQFNGNIYQGINEVLIVSSPGKDDKVHLEEGSMIVTGVTTPEQVLEVKNAIKNQPATLAELKEAFTKESEVLGLTNNYIIGQNKLVNEFGATVNTKSISGAASLVGVSGTVGQPTGSSSGSSSVENNGTEEKKSEPSSAPSSSPAPTSSPEPTPSPSPVPSCPNEANHPGLHAGTQCPQCSYIGTAHWCITDGDDTHSCSCGYVEPHKWGDDARCTVCGDECHECDGRGMVGGCTRCGKVGCKVDHNMYCAEWTCSACGKPGTGDHYWRNGRCGNCGAPCPECGGDSDTIPTGSACDTCYLEGTASTECPNAANHASLHIGQNCSSCDYVGEEPHVWVANNDITHKCSICDGDTSTPHDYHNGYCADCDHTCQHDGATEGTCPYCNQSLGTPVSCSVDHDEHCPGWICEVCHKPGTGEHEFEEFDEMSHRCKKCENVFDHNFTPYDGDEENYHGCEACGARAEHDWSNCDGICRACGQLCPKCMALTGEHDDDCDVCNGGM